MQQRTKRDPALFHLVNEYEAIARKGDQAYFEDKDYFQLISFYEDEHEHSKALEVVEYALHQYKFRSDFYIIQARILLDMGEVEKALDVIDRGSHISPMEIEFKLLRVRALCDCGETDAALRVIEESKVLADRSDQTDLLFQEAYIHESTRDFRSMYDSLKKILEIDHLNEEALERIWVSVELCKNYEESVDFHNWLIEKDAYNHLAWYNLGHAYACMMKYEEAIIALEYSFLIDEEFEIGYKDCAELCFQFSQYHRALKVYLSALDKFGYDSELLVSIGQCFIELDQFETAKMYLSKASKIDPFNDEVFYFLAICYAHDSKWASAIYYYHKAIKIEDRREEYYAGLARAYEEVEDYTKADYYYSKATETGPEEPSYWFDHARFLLNIGEVSASLEVLEEAEFHTFGVDLLYCRAAAYFWKGLQKTALEYLWDALDEDVGKADLLEELYPDSGQNQDIQSMIRYFTNR